MNPALSKSLCDTAALTTDSAKSSTTSTLLPFLSGVCPATALMSVAMMSAGRRTRERSQGESAASGAAGSPVCVLPAARRCQAPPPPTCTSARDEAAPRRAALPPSPRAPSSCAHPRGSSRASGAETHARTRAPGTACARRCGAPSHVSVGALCRGRSDARARAAVWHSVRLRVVQGALHAQNERGGEALLLCARFPSSGQPRQATPHQLRVLHPRGRSN